MTVWLWMHSRAVVTPMHRQLPSYRSPSSMWVTHSPTIALVTWFACASVRYTTNTTRTSELQSFDLPVLRYEWATCINCLITPASDWTIPQSLNMMGHSRQKMCCCTSAQIMLQVLSSSVVEAGSFNKKASPLVCL